MEALLRAIQSCETITVPGPIATISTSIRAKKEVELGDYGLDIHFTEATAGGGNRSTAGYRMYLFVLNDNLVQVKRRFGSAGGVAA